MTNNSERTIQYSITDSGLDWQMDVCDSQGKPVGETERLRKLREPHEGLPIATRNMIAWIEPHKKGGDLIEVSLYYDLIRPGRYTMKVQRTFPGVSNANFTSNLLFLKIAP